MTQKRTDGRPTTTITIVVDVDINEAVWMRLMSVGDAQPSRSLVAEVEDYIRWEIADSPTGAKGAIVDVSTTFDCERRWP